MLLGSTASMRGHWNSSSAGSKSGDVAHTIDRTLAEMRLGDIAGAFACCAIGIGVSLDAIYLLLVMIGLAPTSDTCITETKERILNRDGFQFDIVDTTAI